MRYNLCRLLYYIFTPLISALSVPCVNKSKQEGEMKSMCRLVFWVGILCLRIVVAQADTIPCYDSLKLQLHEQSLPLVNLMVDIDHVSKPTYTPAFVEICDPLKRMGGVMA